MKREEAINQLKDLIEDRKSFMVGDYDGVYDKDVQALECAIKELTNKREFVPEDSNGICRDSVKCAKPEVNIFNDIPTKAIVMELSKRECVKVDIADPHKDINVQANGPAIILTVID